MKGKGQEEHLEEYLERAFCLINIYSRLKIVSSDLKGVKEDLMSARILVLTVDISKNLIYTGNSDIDFTKFHSL